MSRGHYCVGSFSDSDYRLPIRPRSLNQENAFLLVAAIEELLFLGLTPARLFAADPVIVPIKMRPIARITALHWCGPCSSGLRTICEHLPLRLRLPTKFGPRSICRNRCWRRLRMSAMTVIVASLAIVMTAFLVQSAGMCMHHAIAADQHQTHVEPLHDAPLPAAQLVPI